MSEQAKRAKKTNRYGRWLIALTAVLIGCNIAAYYFHGQLDLTKDKRYTLTPATKQMLQRLDHKIRIEVFLTGEDLPAAFQSLSNSTASLLRQFRDLSNNQVIYRFTDPLDNDTLALHTLAQYKMTGIPVTVSAGKKGNTQKMIFPWALVSILDEQGHTQAFPVFLQETNTMELSRKILSRSEMLLEYNLANAIQQVMRKEIPAVAYLTGNEEEFGLSVWSAFGTLGRLYRLDTFNLQAHMEIPETYSSIIINRPMKAFSEIDKFKIDQYLMRGGHIFLSINAVTGTIDSLQTGRFNAMPVDLNMSDLFFNYGFRINTNLILDAVDYAGVPLKSPGENAQTSIFPWIYFPVLKPGSDHPIAKNTNGILARFVSSIDTNANDPDIKKTVLLASSKYSKTEAAPLPILLESALDQLNPATFPKAHLPAAWLLEGDFTSAFASRQPLELSQWMDTTGMQKIDKALRPGKIIVVGDGDLLVNEFDPQQGPAEMGIYRFSDYRFDNKSFLLNAMDYLNNPDNLLEARTRSFENGILDPKRVTAERTQWQFINLLVPIALLLLLGGIFTVVRKKKYN